MRAVACVPVLLLAACGSQPEPRSETPGTRLEAAAVQAGLVADPARATLIGSWARDTDRACVVPGTGDRLRIGVLIDYGEGQGCAARGIAQRRGNRVAVEFGACLFEADFDGERIVFPAEMPGACDRLCTGRATLAALSVERLSTAVAEAETLRTPGGRMLCAPAG